MFNCLENKQTKGKNDVKSKTDSCFWIRDFCSLRFLFSFFFDRLTKGKNMETEKTLADLSTLPDAVIFNGSITIENENTGEHRTFRIKTQKEDSKFAPNMRIVSLLNGPDNWSNYQGFGFAFDDAGFKVWKSKRGNGKPSAFEYFADMLNHFFGFNSRIDWTNKGYSCQIEKKCIVCNRKLTHPESLRTGIGPICANRE